MIKKSALLMGFVLAMGCFEAGARDFVEYGRSTKGRSSRNNDQRNNAGFQQDAGPGTGEDQDIVDLSLKRKGADYVEGGGMIVTDIFKDDNSGLRHQKWQVRLTNGMLMEAHYNLDMCERVDLRIGDTVSMGGEFIWTKGGGLLHWLHFDPRERRQDGYVEVNGKVYCGDGQRHR